MAIILAGDRLIDRHDHQNPKILDHRADLVRLMHVRARLACVINSAVHLVRLKWLQSAD